MLSCLFRSRIRSKLYFPEVTSLVNFLIFPEVPAATFYPRLLKCVFQYLFYYVTKHFHKIFLFHIFDVAYNLLTKSDHVLL